MDHYQKCSIALYYWLLGRDYTKAAECFNFAKKYHTGTRKDGITPEFAHQVSICSFMRTFDTVLMYPEETYCAILLHDVMEDYKVPYSIIKELAGEDVANAVLRLSKVVSGLRKSDEDYYGQMRECPIASISKIADRIHNIQSMPGVFSEEKQAIYIQESVNFVYPLIKEARRNFPAQEPIYECMKLILRSQIYLIDKSYDKNNNS